VSLRADLFSIPCLELISEPEVRQPQMGAIISTVQWIVFYS